MTENNNSQATKEGGQNGKWYDILKLIPPRARAIALVALLSEAVVIAVIKLLPEAQRIYGFIVFACILIATLIGAVLVMQISASQDHNQPNLGAKVEKLTRTLVENRFRPDLIVAIPRGGLVIAGLLTKQLGDEEIVPVISLTRLDGSGFKNPFNHLGFKLENFQITPVKILIVDDICRSGRTLAEARTFVEDSIGQSDFDIRTAAISFYYSYPHATRPSFFVDRPRESVIDASGDVEEM